MQIICPKCHQSSSEPDFCSECGAPIQAAGAPAANPVVAAPHPTAASGVMSNASVVQKCPVCGVERGSPHARFCDNCRYDFIEGKAYTGDSAPDPIPPTPLLASAFAPAPVSVPAASPSVPAASSPVNFVPEALIGWDIVASVDPDGRGPDGQAPSDMRERVFPLDLSDNLIGRRSDKDGVHPEIELTDIGVSKRHARILRKQNGDLMLLDLRSTNGTVLNGAPIDPNIETPLGENDVVSLGCWTRLHLRMR